MPQGVQFVTSLPLAQSSTRIRADRGHVLNTTTSSSESVWERNVGEKIFFTLHEQHQKQVLLSTLITTCSMMSLFFQFWLTSEKTRHLCPQNLQTYTIFRPDWNAWTTYTNCNTSCCCNSFLHEMSRYSDVVHATRFSLKMIVNAQQCKEVFLFNTLGKQEVWSRVRGKLDKKQSQGWSEQWEKENVEHHLHLFLASTFSWMADLQTAVCELVISTIVHRRTNQVRSNKKKEMKLSELSRDCKATANVTLLLIIILSEW